MKKKISIIVVLVLAVVAWSCKDVTKPSRVYMPDMAYSRAYEAYSSLDTLNKQGIHYNMIPVAGTIKRGELFPFPIAKDKTGDTANYVQSRQVVNPLPALDANQLVEAERLFLVNCAICHGAKLDGNGVLHKRSDGTDGPYAAAPAVLVGNPNYENMPEGQMFYSVTYGKGQMGSYASQLSTTQRWMVIHYIKSRQGAGKAKTASGAMDSTATKLAAPAAGAKTDSTVKK